MTLAFSTVFICRIAAPRRPEYASVVSLSRQRCETATGELPRSRSLPGSVAVRGAESRLGRRWSRYRAWCVRSRSQNTNQIGILGSNMQAIKLVLVADVLLRNQSIGRVSVRSLTTPPHFLKISTSRKKITVRKKKPKTHRWECRKTCFLELFWNEI